MRKLLLISVGLLTIPAIAVAVPSPKYFVCKYVGTPGVNETLQTGQNPISVSGNALTPPVVVGGSFNDAQGRSYVVAEDTGQAEPTCPVPQNPTPPPEPAPSPSPTPTPSPTPASTPVAPTPTPPTTVTPASVTQTTEDINPNTFQGK